MDDGMLSQDEIDALLNITDNNDGKNEQNNEPRESEELVSDYLSSIEVDTLGEIGNISFGTSATTLSTLLNQKVDITTPKVSVIKKSALSSAFSFEHIQVNVRYEEGFSGENLFVIKSEDAAIISDIMLGGDGLSPDKELNEIHLSAVQEAMNQMMGASATSMATIFGKVVNISPPDIKLIEESTEENKQKQTSSTDQLFVKVSFQLKVGELIDSKIMQLIPFPFAHELVVELLNTSPKEENADIAIELNNDEQTEQQAKEDHEETDEEAITQKSEQQYQNDQSTSQFNSSPQYIGNPVDQTKSAIQPAEFSEFDEVNFNQNAQRNLDLLLDIPLKVTVELGRTKRPIKDILDLTSGSIIELDKLAGEPVDVLVNEKLIAKGEVVVIDENFGVRLTDIISQSARIMKLK